MADVAAVRAPVENVNDETIFIVRWLVENGQTVSKDAPLLLAETSKTSFDIVAPVDGVVWKVVDQGIDVPVNDVLCYIGESERDARAAHDRPADAMPLVARSDGPAASEPAQAPGAAGSSPRFSGKALPLLEQFGLRPEDFAGMGLVREQDVRDRAAGRGVGASSAAAAAGATPQVVRPADKLAIHPAAGVGTRVESLPRSKRVEIRHLRAGAAHTLPSAVTVAVPTNGFLSSASQRADAIGLAAATIIFETARLLRRYPMFNAFYHDDAAHYYEQVNIGYAVDVDRGLKVPVIHNADRRSLQDLAAEKQQRLVEYLDDALPLEALAGGTFTITDLSHEGVTHFQPVIHEGQAAILGVCAEWQTGGEPRACFNLVLAFDHQLADGRTAATFLRELRDRLRAHEASLGVAANAGAEAQCSLCFRPVSELAEARHYLVRTIGADGRVDQAVCTMCLADW